MEAVFERVSRERIYAVTGIQFLPFNTIYQLYAACRATPDLVDAARALITIPDLLNYWLTGKLTSEYTVATTTQCIDARTRTWATRMLDQIGLPTRLLPTARGAGDDDRHDPAERVGGVRGNAGRGPGLSRHRIGGGVVLGFRQYRVLELGHLVAAGHRAARAADYVARRSLSTSPTKAASAARRGC